MEEKNNDDIEKLPKEEEKLINSQSIHNFELIDNSTNMTQAPENEKQIHHLLIQKRILNGFIAIKIENLVKIIHYFLYLIGKQLYMIN